MKNVIRKIKKVWNDPKEEFSREVSQKEKEVLFAQQVKSRATLDMMS